MLDATLGITLGEFELDASLTVRAGEVLALVGPNGAGKTTVLRAVAGLQPIDRGRMTIDGAVVDDPDAGTLVPTEQRAIGVVFQDYLLFPHLSALDNVAFGLRARGRTRLEAQASARRVLDGLGVGERADAKPADLSGGQAQRVALARALAIEPRVLLLDEPLAALDPGARDSIRRDLREHLRRFNGATVLVSHDSVDAAVLADKIVILDGGRVVQSGPVSEVLARPRSRYVADLVGVNLFEGDADGNQVHIDGGEHVVVADYVHGPVFVVIAPRAIALSNEEPHGSARNHWPTRIAGIETVGDRARVRLVGRMSFVAEVTAASVADLGLREGQEVWAIVKATEVGTTPR